MVEEKDGDGKVIRTTERTFTRNVERCFSSDEQRSVNASSAQRHLETDEPLTSSL